MSWAPHVTVATVVERDGLFLLVYEFDKDLGRMVYNQPAGHWDEGESLQEAAIRETLEESAWRVEISYWLGLYSYVSESSGFTYLRVVFAGRALEKTDTPLDAGIQEAVWLSYDEILYKHAAGKLRNPLILRAVEDYRNGRHLPLDVIYTHKAEVATRSD